MEKSFVFDAVLVDGVYDRQYLSSDFCNYFGSFISNGVFPNPSTNLQVTASNNFDVAVLAGRAFINGRTYHNTDKLLFTLDVADGVLNRIDTVVVQVNHLAREIKTVIKKGTFAVNPIPPELTNNADYEEIQLAQIYIKAGAINITQADITDTRLDKSVCGVVSQMVQTVDTTTLFNQYKSWYEQTTGKAIKDIAAFEVQFKSDMLAWANELNAALGENAAINLFNLINELKSTTYTKSQTDLTRTYTLTHSKLGAVHTLAGLPTTSGIYQCQFVATADYAEWETFAYGYTAKPNGEETTLPDKAFVSGDIVSVTVDVGGKKLGFKLGGGGGYGTLSPQIRNFTAKAGNHQITLNWTNPSDSNFAGLYIVRKQGSMPTKLSDGTKINVVKATNYTDNEPENDKLYYYRVFTYNQKKQVQTELTGAVVSATPSSFILPTFTGQHAIFGDSTKGRLEMYTSGTLTLQSSSYDVFAVGGGGAGYKNDEGYPNGAGGGYVETIKNKTLSGNYVVTIGAGGIQSKGTSDGGATHFTDVAHADGGADSFSGGNGGSGGGGGTRGSSNAGDGGTDGSDGKPSSDGNKGGTGQHVTTKAFGDIDSVSYSGGGGGYSASGNHGLGKDGGGNGGGGKGTANTGGGGGGGTGSAGGSGIAIIRWGY